MRSGALGGRVMLDRLPEQIFVDGAENFLGQIHRPDLRSAQVVDINRCHMLSRLVWRGRPRPRLLISRLSYPFLAALFAAFNGSTVAEPANPRRSRGGFFDLVMIKYPPFGPGTLPSTTRRLSSFSTPSTRRLRTVTRALPMCPDIRIPLNTRDGNADDPIDPVI